MGTNLVQNNEKNDGRNKQGNKRLRKKRMKKNENYWLSVGWEKRGNCNKFYGIPNIFCQFYFMAH